MEEMVKVTWIDSVSGGSKWMTPEEAMRSKPSIITTIGYVVNKTDDRRTAATITFMSPCRGDATAENQLPTIIVESNMA